MREAHRLDHAIDLKNLPLAHGKPITQVTMGDGHANVIKLIYTMVENGICRIDSKKYAELIRIYETKPLTETLFNDFNSIIQNDLKLINKDILLRLIGDMIADRGRNDWFVLHTLDVLHKKGLQFRVIASNHDSEFMKPLFNQTLMKDNEFSKKYKQGNSLLELQESIIDGIVLESDISRIMRETYLPNIVLLDYSLSPDKSHLTLFTHAPCTLNSIKNTAKALNVDYNDATPEKLAETIEQMNQSFLFILSRKRGSDFVFSDPEILNLLWIRENELFKATVDNRGTLHGYTFVNGHDSPNKYVKSENIIRLDNNLGKELLGNADKDKTVAFISDERVAPKRALPELSEDKIEALSGKILDKMNDIYRPVKESVQERVKEVRLRIKKVTELLNDPDKKENVALNNELRELKARYNADLNRLNELNGSLSKGSTYYSQLNEAWFPVRQSNSASVQAVSTSVNTQTLHQRPETPEFKENMGKLSDALFPNLLPLFQMRVGKALNDTTIRTCDDLKTNLSPEQKGSLNRVLAKTSLADRVAEMQRIVLEHQNTSLAVPVFSSSTGQMLNCLDGVSINQGEKQSMEFSFLDEWESEGLISKRDSSSPWTESNYALPPCEKLNTLSEHCKQFSETEAPQDSALVIKIQTEIEQFKEDINKFLTEFYPELSNLRRRHVYNLIQSNKEIPDIFKKHLVQEINSLARVVAKTDVNGRLEEMTAILAEREQSNFIALMDILKNAVESKPVLMKKVERISDHQPNETDITKLTFKPDQLAALQTALENHKLNAKDPIVIALRARVTEEQEKKSTSGHSL